MSKPKIIGQEASIVLVGNFNPTIFHPDWFLRYDIIPEVDREGADIEIIHPEIAKFNFPWVGIEVLQKRFVARTQDPSHFSPLRDLVVSTFSILEHSPVSQLGMNLTINYTVADEKTWHKIGDSLAPKTIWKKSLPERVGLLLLRVQSPRTDTLPGNIKVTVESREEFGITININSHVELDESINVIDILSDRWEATMEQATDIANTTIDEAIK